MASPTKILETIRSRKRNKLLVARAKRVRLEANKKANKVDESLRRFVAGASKKPLTKIAAREAAKAAAAKASGK
jgi:hypothetical protein